MKNLNNNYKKIVLSLSLMFCMSYTAKAAPYIVDSLSQWYSYADGGTLSVYLKIDHVSGFEINGINYQLQNDTLNIDVCIIDILIPVSTTKEATLKMSIYHTVLPNYYTVSLYNGVGCSSLISSNHYLPNMLTTGVNEQSSELNKSINVYPNPSQAFINLALSKNMKITEIALYDMMGKRLKLYDASERKLDVNDISGGQYILKITTDEGIITKKVQIEH